MSTKAIESVLAENSNKLIALDGVIGIAIGKFKRMPCINVYVVQKNQELMKNIPATLDGYQVKVRETGKLQALN